MTPNRSYDVKISAVNSFGIGRSSDLVRAETSVIGVPIQVPEAPSDLADDISLRTPTSMTLTWALNGNGGDVITNFIITVTSGTVRVINVPGGIVPEYVIDQLVIDTYYSITVQAENSVGVSAASIAYADTFANVPSAPAAPTTSNNGEYVVVSW